MSTIFGLFLLCLLFLLFILFLAIILYLIWALSTGRSPFAPTKYPPREFYVQNQIILTGPGVVLDRLAAQLSSSLLVSLVRLDRLPFSELGEGVGGCPGLPAPAEGLVIDLYQIGGLFSNVARAIRRINRVLGDQAGVVIKDPNWLTGQPFDPEGSPFDPEGSPFEPAGSPFDPEGSLIGGDTVLADSADFMAQWAFRVIDLAAGRFKAEGVRVGIFDSSPFGNVPSDTLVHKVISMQGMPVNKLGEFSLDVLHPTPSARPAASGRRNIDVRNHGFFIAGLIHAVAPQSQLRLVRVLENDNRGDLFTLLKAIFNFLKENQSEDLTGQVINLSLGVRLPPEEAKFGLPAEILSLQYLMSAARCLGAVVAAAAGNDSYKGPLPLPSNLPAGWPTGLGVAATNDENQRSCFSNRGRLAAPGGDGRSEKETDHDCKPRNDECTDEDFSRAIVGPILRPPYNDDNNNGYIFWSGSSFSTPLVSGLAALVMRAGDGDLSPAEVENLILCCCSPTGDPYLGAGVINVKHTLTECMQAKPAEKGRRPKAAK
jgi:hypothetical protein